MFKNSHKPCILKNCSEFLKIVYHHFFEKHWSIDACVGYAKKHQLFDNILCSKTLYNYIDRGLTIISNTDSPLKLRRSMKKSLTRDNKKILGKSISQRPNHVNKPTEFDHWELDTVVDKKKDQKVILSLIERKTRYYIPILVNVKNTDSINRVFRLINEYFGDKFNQVFKSITCDNDRNLQKCHQLLIAK